jgi:hypothetical protein
MFEFKLDKVAKMGEKDEMYGQVYWCTVEGEELPIKFNSQNDSIKDFDTITAEEKAMKKTVKGDKTYWQLRKVKVVSSGASTVSSGIPTPEQTPRSDQLDRIESKIDTILNIVDTGVDIPEDEDPEGMDEAREMLHS